MYPPSIYICRHRVWPRRTHPCFLIQHCLPPKAPSYLYLNRHIQPRKLNKQQLAQLWKPSPHRQSRVIGLMIINPLRLHHHKKQSQKKTTEAYRGIGSGKRDDQQPGPPITGQLFTISAPKTCACCVCEFTAPPVSSPGTAVNWVACDGEGNHFCHTAICVPHQVTDNAQFFCPCHFDWLCHLFIY